MTPAPEEKAREVATGLSGGMRLLVLEFTSRRMSNDYRATKRELAEAERLGLTEWFEKTYPWGHTERRRRATEFCRLVATHLQKES